ncbi:MAG: helix-turn-helix transcriptional regulator [Rhizobacter sp.]|nr:helix-turn-helix transcriptional regulator [Rhizobacter sp.]
MNDLPANQTPDEARQQPAEAPAFPMAEPRFIPEPMRATHGQPPESLLGKRLAKAREHYTLKVEALSRLTKSYDAEGRGISPPSLARYESGESSPGARELRLLSEALEVSSHWLIFGETDVAGSSDAEQRLVSALKGFVSEQIGAAATREFDANSEWHRGLVRASRMAEARKPSSP